MEKFTRGFHFLLTRLLAKMQIQNQRYQIIAFSDFTFQIFFLWDGEREEVVALLCFLVFMLGDY